MKTIQYIATIALTLMTVSLSNAQTTVSDLGSELRSGNLSIENLRGTGSSSGLSIQGRIENTTSSPIRIRISLRPAIFLGNRTSRSRQNMIAFSIFQRGGGYYKREGVSYIEFPANQSVAVDMIAYCADFEKENPSSTDSFEAYAVPEELAAVTRKIAAYKNANPDEEVTVAAQVALWLGQGLSPSQIRTTFQFTPSDERKARQILGY